MTGKVVLVTGASGGLGAYVTRDFLDAGATVIGTSRKISQSDFAAPNFIALAGEISTPAGHYRPRPPPKPPPPWDGPPPPPCETLPPSERCVTMGCLISSGGRE